MAHTYKPTRQQQKVEHCLCSINNRLDFFWDAVQDALKVGAISDGTAVRNFHTNLREIDRLLLQLTATPTALDKVYVAMVGITMVSSVSISEVVEKTDQIRNLLQSVKDALPEPNRHRAALDTIKRKLPLTYVLKWAYH